MSLHWQWQAPTKALCAFALAVGATLFDDYLGQAQEYLMNYRLLMYLVVLLGAVVLATQVLLYPLVKRSQLCAILERVSIYFVLYQLLDWGEMWFGFKYTPLAGWCVPVVALGVFVWLLKDMLKPHLPTQSALRLGILCGALPVLVLTVYSYLAHHNFYAQRAGSYPVYHTHLFHQTEQGQSIKQFFKLTEPHNGV